MTVQELRIGNLINYEMTTHIVTGIQISGLVSSKWKNDKDDEEYYHCSVDSIEGIKLSSEILEKAGFKYSEYYQEYCYPISCDLYFELKFVKDYYYPTLHKEPEFSSGDEQVFGSNRIQYLHELQNLIFILQGTELTINI